MTRWSAEAFMQGVHPLQISEPSSSSSFISSSLHPQETFLESLNPDTDGPHTSTGLLLYDARRGATLTLVACPLDHRKRVCRMIATWAAASPTACEVSQWCFGASYQTHIVAPRTPNSWGTISGTQVLESFPASTRGLGFRRSLMAGSAAILCMGGLI